MLLKIELWVPMGRCLWVILITNNAYLLRLSGHDSLRHTCHVKALVARACDTIGIEAFGAHGHAALLRVRRLVYPPACLACCKVHPLR